MKMMAEVPEIGTRVRILKEGSHKGKAGVVIHIDELTKPMEFLVSYDGSNPDAFDPYDYYTLEQIEILPEGEQADEKGQVLIQQQLGENDLERLQAAVERYSSYYSIKTSDLRALLRVYRAYYDDWYDRH
jgi:hypothetical protein